MQEIKNNKILNCKNTDIEKCRKCDVFEECQNFKDSQEKEFHKELILEQHSNG